jgi:hypothetical protein
LDSETNTVQGPFYNVVIGKMLRRKLRFYFNKNYLLQGTHYLWQEKEVMARKENKTIHRIRAKIVVFTVAAMHALDDSVRPQSLYLFSRPGPI